MCPARGQFRVVVWLFVRCAVVCCPAAALALRPSVSATRARARAQISWVYPLARHALAFTP
jgi:hypothetical protein